MTSDLDTHRDREFGLAATNSFVHDLNGNLTSDGSRGFDYDDENQMIRITATNLWKSEFSYDGKMRCRIEKNFGWTGGAWVQTNESRFVYDGNLVIEERDGNNLPNVVYARGTDLSGSFQGAGGIGGLLARLDYWLLAIGDSRASAFYHADGNGNVTMLINASQVVVARYEYDPFGNMLSISGPKAYANRYRFSSKPIHELSGSYDFCYREVDPIVWTTERRN